MIYGLPENLTREDVRREYTIVNMRFNGLQGKMEPHHRKDASRLLGYVKEDLAHQPNTETELPEHTIYSLMLAEGLISKYRGETKEDLEVAEGIFRDLSLRHIDLIRSRTSLDRKAGSHISLAFNALDDIDHQHPDTYTRAIDKAMFNLGEAEKLIVEAEQKPVEVGV